MLSSTCHLPRQCQSQSLLNATAGQSWLWATEMCCWQAGCAPPLLRAVKAKMSGRRNKALFLSDYKCTRSHTCLVSNSY